MNAAPAQAPLAFLDLAARLGTILAGLAALVAHAFLKDPKHVAIIVPLWGYIGRTARRFARLAARVATGRKPRIARAAQPRTGKPRSPIRLPHSHAWLTVALKHHGAAYAAQLDHLLAQPEAAEFFAAAPQAARLLRPLCRMLGITPTVIPPLPPRPRKPRPRPAPKPKRLSRKQREAILWYPNLEGRPMKLLPPRKFRA